MYCVVHLRQEVRAVRAPGTATVEYSVVAILEAQSDPKAGSYSPKRGRLTVGLPVAVTTHVERVQPRRILHKIHIFRVTRS
jgi:hypothetical protein